MIEWDANKQQLSRCFIETEPRIGDQWADGIDICIQVLTNSLATVTRKILILQWWRSSPVGS